MKQVEKIYDNGCQFKMILKNHRGAQSARLSNYGPQWAGDCQGVVVCKSDDHGGDNAEIKIMLRSPRAKKFKVLRATCSELSDLFVLLYGLAEHTNMFSIPRGMALVPPQNAPSTQEG